MHSQVVHNKNRAKTYSRYAENEMDKYETQLRYATQADDKATMYLRWAADALKKLQQKDINYGKTTFKSNNSCPQSTRRTG